MATGDGLLVRVTAEMLAPAALTGLADAARRYGNGRLDVTARGNLQIRGLTARSAPAFADAAAELGLVPGDAPVIALSPLAGLDPTEVDDPRPLAAGLRRSIAGGGFGDRLGPKVSIVIDGGGAPWLDDVLADVRLHAVSPSRWVVALAGSGRDARVVTEALASTQAIAACCDVLRRIARRGPAARARDLQHPAGPPLLARPGFESLGRHRLSDGRLAATAGLPFGQLDVVTLLRLGEQAASLGLSGLRPVAGRLLMATAAPEVADRWVAGAGELGLITDAADPRRHVAACSGRPACGSGLLETRKLAAAVVEAWPSQVRATGLVHVSGCSKGCAHPAAAALTLVGLPGAGRDVCGVVRDGRAGDPPADQLDAADLRAYLERQFGSPAHGALLGNGG